MPQKPHTGKPNNDHRTVGNGILRILGTGALWRDMPEENLIFIYKWQYI
ncbi:hypothetical protein [Scytonema sp. NUACC21]